MLWNVRSILVTAPDMEDVRSEVDSTHAIQDKALGTGHAVLAAADHMTGMDDVLVLYGDTPLVTAETVQAMIQEKQDAGADMAVLGMRLENPGHYGRLVGNAEGFVERIVEFKDANAEERDIEFCNSGIVLISGQHARDLLTAIDNKNAKGEYYLTDIIEIGANKGLKTIAVEGAPEEFMGVNSPEELASAEYLFQERQRLKFLEQGVRMQDPTTVYFAYDTEVAPDVSLEPHVYFGPGVSVATQATIRAFSHLEGCTVHAEAIVGPYARIRPGTSLGKQSRVGNFVEIKKSTVGEGSKISHLSYVGDADIGAQVNIGAGTITCNYDGYHKNKTTIQDNVFIGSNTALVAPITIGKNALVGAGSTLTQDVKKDGLALSRKEQANIDNGAKKFRAKRGEGNHVRYRWYSWA